MLITGTFFEFCHHSPVEGTYYNPALRSFTDGQWAEMIRDIYALGMDTLVLMFSSLVTPDGSESYAPVTVFPQAEMGCRRPMDVLMDTAEELGMHVYLSAGFYGVWLHPVDNMQSREVQARAFKACEQMLEKYAKYACFEGWYLPDETEAGPYFSPVFLDYVNRYSTFFRRITPEKKIVIAPYGTNQIRPDDIFVRQLEGLDVDAVAYQDEVGVQKSRPEETGAYYEGLRKAHDRAGRSHLWADMEIFRFEDQPYKSALLPAEMERIEKQMASIRPHVEKILVYAYPGMMARPGSIAGYGYPEPEKLYAAYDAYRKRHV